MFTLLDDSLDWASLELSEHSSLDVLLRHLSEDS